MSEHVIPPVTSDWGEYDAAQLHLLTLTLVAVVRELSRQTPPPRGMPFFALDHPAGECTPYEHLAARGIFRKYESVLLVGAGLGGAARWCHAHFGCDVTGVEAVREAAASAAELSTRSRLAAHTRFVAAAAEALPLRRGQFTHAWLIEGLLDVESGDQRLRQVFDAVRIGGLVGVQQSGAAPDWAERCRGALLSAGLVEAEIRVVERPPLRESLRRARQRLLQALRRSSEPLGSATAAAVERMHRRWPVEGGAVAQVLARRPA